MTDLFPMSFAQRRLCLLHGLDPSGFAHGSARCFQVTGPLDLSALRGALDLLVARHEPLRTVFPLGALQRVFPTGRAFPRVLDVADEAEAARRLDALVSEPFDVEHGPLARLTVLRWAETSHLLVFCLHLLVADGWSAQVFFEELSLAYRARLTGEALDWPELPVQYVDWAAWQREQLTEPRREALERWWREWLAGVPPMLDLVPYRRARGQGQRIQRPLSEALLSRLRAQASAEGQTLFTVLAAACGLVVGRLADRERLVLGLAVANRDPPEVERVLGFFVNTVALRIDLGGGPSFRELLVRVAESTAAALAHQALPFEQVVAAIDPPRDPDRSPLVQVNFAHHPLGSLGVLALAGCAVTERVLDFVPVKFELTLKVEETADGGARVGAEFDEGLFPPGVVETLLATYEDVLESAASERPVAEWMLPRTETQRAVARLFAQVLGVDAVGLHEDFFRRGGHSLLLVELAARIRAGFGRDLPLHALYARPTVAGVAARLEQETPR
ncbi:condensation domain-containing protein [Melittangium boletus]|uniref:condensation domain-containing protein n=1 Tax=Melittangium boletus TaxID=83453 RepID=UPI003DA5922A